MPKNILKIILININYKINKNNVSIKLSTTIIITLNKFERQNPNRVSQHTHVHKPECIPQQARIKYLNMPVLSHQLIHKEVRHQLTDMVNHTRNTVQGWRPAHVLQMPEQKREHQANANAHKPDNKQENAKLH